MPKITVTKPFNYKTGPQVKNYPKGDHDVPQAVADHAYAHSFAAKPKAEKANTEQAPA